MNDEPSTRICHELTLTGKKGIRVDEAGRGLWSPGRRITINLHTRLLSHGGTSQWFPRVVTAVMSQAGRWCASLLSTLFFHRLRNSRYL